MRIFGIYTNLKEFLAGLSESKSQISIEALQEQIPYYLSKEAKEGLLKELGNFPKKINYYLGRYQDEVLQGDGWSSLDIYDFGVGKTKSIKGILLSNSCDIAPENIRALPAKITFSPIIKLNNYVTKLIESGIPRAQIDQKLLAIKDQKVTNVFFLPKGSGLDEDYIALLSDVHTVPYSIFAEKTSRAKQFTLSQIGFYVFVLKLSVHFCRFHENLDRKLA